MKFSVYVIPLIIIILFVYARKRGVMLYDTFAKGAREAIPISVTLFPYLATVFIMAELFEVSGLASLLIKTISPVFKFLGIPEELCRLVLIKPFSGSGSLALLSEIYATHGADSYVARCASVIFGSSETVFYVSAVYFANCKRKKLALPIFVSLFSTLIATVFACFICKVI